jgi:hypothetical protein
MAPSGYIQNVRYYLIFISILLDMLFWLIGLDALCGFIYKARQKSVSRGLDAPNMKNVFQIF